MQSWGEDLFPIPHGIWISPDDRLYIADCGDHTVHICSTDGEALQTLGTPGQPGAYGQPFNQPTRAACLPSGEIYISDGYGQYHVHRLAADGTHLQSWGGSGAEPGYVKEKLCGLLSAVGCREWPQRWPDMFDKIFQGTYVGGNLPGYNYGGQNQEDRQPEG